ncbi:MULTISPECIES: hypothetical protein [unclassified Synechococcus]|uniref:hypothetical protein n=1 Tax=unclassified Synechococcus TaxID=2626047 RepID=UPI0000698D34|nr:MULTISPECIES: hypothetical protein [unclassified Synechococcus]EAQ74608.1 hypothetical protein WH5701_13480 [Synechococcus sp. WH 5701]WFN58574.1 hypothetical protein N4320_12325 [Synechococcus sp. CCFWC 502]
MAPILISPSIRTLSIRSVRCLRPSLAPWLLCVAVALPCLAWVAPARSGSVSADSVWDRGNALQRARQLVPRGAIPGRHRCQEMTVGMGNYRYRCTVEFSQPASPLPGPAGAQSSP